MAEELRRKKNVRRGHRAAVTRMVNRSEELLAADPTDTFKLSQIKLALTEKLQVLKQLDDEYLGLIKEEEIATDIEQSDEFKEGMYAAIIRIDQAITPMPAPVPARGPPILPADPHPPDSKVKLPKLTLQPFDGDLTSWTPFWDSFEVAVHANRSLSDVDKFNYLKGLLQRTALEAISGLALTAANYQEAITILKKRFGNKSQIIAKHMDVLMHVDSVSSSSNVKGLRRLYDSVESNVRSLKSLGVDKDSYGNLLAPVLITKIPQELQLTLNRKIGSDDWNLDRLMSCFEEELQAREKTAAMSIPSVKKPSKDQGTATFLLTGSSKRPTCSYCQEDHASHTCSVVVQPHARRQVLQKTGRCFVCLRRGHISRDCNSHKKCYKCNGRHHTSICTQNSSVTSGQPSTKTSSQATTPSQSSLPTATPSNVPQPGLNTKAPAFQSQQARSTSLWVKSSNSILLQTARAQAYNPDSPEKSCRVRLVLDSGSQRSYVTEQLVRELSLTTKGQQSMTIMTFGSTNEQTKVCDCVRLNLALGSGKMIQLVLFTVPLICEPLACQPVSLCQDRFPHLADLDLADCVDGNSQLDVDILVGSDQYWDLATGETRRGSSGPVAVNTKLGWVLSGPATTCNQTSSSTSLITHTLRVDSFTLDTRALDDRLKSFWDLESFGILPTSFKAESSVYDEFENSVRMIDGRYQVELPWKESHPTLPDNFSLCLRRLHGLTRRLQQSPAVLQEYDSTIKNQIHQGIVEPVNADIDECQGMVHYLPHHAVIRQDRDTTKIRVVYDASARLNGPSLNDCLHSGPKFDQKILDILLRFRTHRVAVTADVEKAFLMISMAQHDRDVLRFLWYDNVLADEPRIIHLRFTRVVFGVTSSPFLLNATIRHHLEQFRDAQPRLVEKLSKSAYVDDIVTGAEDEEQAHQLFTSAKTMFRVGGFNLRKFCTNSHLLQMKIDGQKASEDYSDHASEETYTSATLGVGQTPHAGERKVLGVRWDLATDQLFVSLGEIASAADTLQPTKRTIVSLIGKIYDPLGILSPVVVQLKVFVQGLYEAKLGWDQLLTGKTLERWHYLSSSLSEATTFSIPRCYYDGVSEPISSQTLCGFCDASLKAYAAVVYLVIETALGRHVRLLASKTRVAPLKTQTIPRLELLSALLLARLILSISQALESEVSLSEPHCFTDSTVALFWIRGVKKTWKPFVQNRVSEIRTLLSPDSWLHCSGRGNPADLPSRGCTLQQLADSQFWINGPEWLKTGKLHELTDLKMPEECRVEMKSDRTHGLLTATEPIGIGQVLEGKNLTDPQHQPSSRE